MTNTISASINLHNARVTNVTRHDMGTLAVTVGEWPLSATLFFHNSEDFAAFVAPVQRFLADEAAGLSAQTSWLVS